jgi:hypothetical protein
MAGIDMALTPHYPDNNQARPIMHLSHEIQERLHKLNSIVKLASTIDGTFPDRYSFYDNPGRSFRAQFAMSDKDFSIVLFERTGNQVYEYCFARGLFTNIDRLTTVINLWVSNQGDIQEIKSQFEELDLYTDFENKNPDSDIDKAWTKVRNLFFNDTKFWKNVEWKSRYVELLNEAKRHNSFKHYFPFTSHYWLRFSIDRKLKEIWPLYVYIIPTMYSNEISETFGKFYVSFNEKPLSGQFFENAKEGLDFYARKLVEIKNH